MGRPHNAEEAEQADIKRPDLSAGSGLCLVTCEGGIGNSSANAYRGRESVVSADRYIDRSLFLSLFISPARADIAVFIPRSAKTLWGYWWFLCLR